MIGARASQAALLLVSLLYPSLVRVGVTATPGWLWVTPRDLGYRALSGSAPSDAGWKGERSEQPTVKTSARRWRAAVSASVGGAALALPWRCSRMLWHGGGLARLWQWSLALPRRCCWSVSFLDWRSTRPPLAQLRTDAFASQRPRSCT